MPDNSPTERDRPDACPGALRVHDAADGGLARVRVPGGALSTQRLRAVSDASVELGHPGVELTSRANMQVRGIAAGTEQQLAERLAAAGLLPSPTHERVRNIVASPYTGCDGPAPVDVPELVRRLDEQLCGVPRLAELPGRFLFTVDDGRGDVAGLGADVGLVVTGPDELAVLLAGTDHGLRVRVAEVVRAALVAADAFLDRRGSSGAWRMAELDDVSAVARSVRTALGRQAAVADVTPVGEGGAVEARQSQVGVVAAHDETVALAVGAPLGRLSPTQLHSIMRAAGAAAGTVRLTPWRTVVIPGVDTREADSWLAALGADGLVVDPASAWVGVTACTGSPGCAKSFADVRGDAARTLARTGETDRALPVHWVGCERRCGRPRGAAVEVLATPDGYRVGVGSRADADDEVRATAAAVPDVAGVIAEARAGTPNEEHDETVNEDSR